MTGLENGFIQQDPFGRLGAPDTASPQLALNRRAVIVQSVSIGAAALSSGALAEEKPQDGSDPPLKDLARQKGLRFGSAVGIASLTARTGAFFDPAYRQILERDCNLIVPENELKMYAVHGNAQDYTFAAADALLQFAEARHIAMRGHNLIWARDEYTPPWLKASDFGAAPKVEAGRLLRDYIRIVTRHYDERLTSWDVVNEAVDPKTGQIRGQVFTRVLGPEALKIAFVAARENLPNTQLVYNDYMSWEAGNETHRQGVLTLLRGFRKNHVPVDALGVQSHIGAGFDLSGGQHGQWKAFLDEVVGLGYQLLITEFDVNDQHLAGSIEMRDQKIAEVAREYLDMMLSYKALKNILVWGLDDKYSWLQSFSPRPDKLPLRPTPYDADFRAKPLRGAIAAAIQAAPAR